MNKDLIHRFFRSETSENENKEIIRWLSNPANEEEVSAIFKSEWDQAKALQADGQFDQSATLELIKSKLNDSKVVSIDANVEKVGVWKRVMQIAAIIAIATGMVYFSFDLSSRQGAEIAQVKMTEKITARGQRSTILLSDGTKIYLNSESKIAYGENYGLKIREVHLEGEAFFDVAKDPDRPFKVLTSNSVTTALGTSFNITAYPEDQVSTISLATGKVEVIKTNNENGETEAIFLSPGEEAVVNGRRSDIVKQGFDSKSTLSWKEGRLYFENTDFEETLKILERWYDVKFTVHSHRDLKSIRGTGEFDGGEVLGNVLHVLGYSMNFKYEIKGKNVIINFNS